MKYVFILVLLLVGRRRCAAGRRSWRSAWVNNMTETARIVPGERIFPMPRGAMPRARCTRSLPKEQRDAGRHASPNPVKPAGSLRSRWARQLPDVLRAVPRAGGQGRHDGLGGGQVHPAAGPAPTPSSRRQRTDGYWHSYIMVGGAVMPSYGEALSSQEALAHRQLPAHAWPPR